MSWFGSDASVGRYCRQTNRLVSKTEQVCVSRSCSSRHRVVPLRLACQHSTLVPAGVLPSSLRHISSDSSAMYRRVRRVPRTVRRTIDGATPNAKESVYAVSSSGNICLTQCSLEYSCDLPPSKRARTEAQVSAAESPTSLPTSECQMSPPGRSTAVNIATPTETLLLDNSSPQESIETALSGDMPEHIPEPTTSPPTNDRDCGTSSERNKVCLPLC